jgi:predicted RNA-binding protein with PUA-like domain
LQDYEKLNISDVVRFEFELKVKSLPNYNNQHSIIPITKELYNLIISRKEQERTDYTIDELTKNTFIKPSEFEEWEGIKGKEASNILRPSRNRENICRHRIFQIPYIQIRWHV